MGGRDQYPGENLTGHGGLLDGGRYLSRIVRGQLSSVDPPNGKAQVNTVEVLSTRNVTVPALWFSGRGRQSAWGRYMPFGGENVFVGYKNDDSPVVTGYDINAGGEQPQEGYQQLKKFADDKVVGYANFRELRPGEFDFKSSGDAYMHGSNQGTLYLAGGQAFIRLDKQAYRLESKASEYHYSSETAQIRFGTVFRKTTPADSAESPVSNGTFKEFLTDVNFPLPSGTPSPQSRAKLHMGDVLDPSTNVPETGPFGAPLRMRLSIGDGADVAEAFSLLIDNLGNIEWLQNNTGTTGLKATANKFIFLPTTTFNVGADAPADFAALANKVLNELNLTKADVQLLANYVQLHFHTTTSTIGPSAVPGVATPPVAPVPTPHTPQSVASQIVLINS